jgi:hypothetical protein
MIFGGKEGHVQHCVPLPTSSVTVEFGSVIRAVVLAGAIRLNGRQK